jgi:O-antigen/teichoic acid export membrane protein
MNDRAALGSRVLIFSLTNALSATVPFLMLPVLTRVLSPDDYGKAAMFSVVITVLSAFTGLNVHGAIGIRYAQKETIDFPRYLASCLAIVLLSSVVVFCIAWILLPWLESATKLPGVWLLAAVVTSSLQFLILIQLTIWQYGNQPWKYGFLRTAQSTLDAGLSLSLIFTFGLAWTGRSGGIAIAAFVVAAVAGVSMWRAQLLRSGPTREYILQALRFGVPLVPHVIGGLLIALLDRVMISAYLGSASTGIYTVALQVGLVLGVATDAFNKAYAPWLIRALANVSLSRNLVIVRYTYLYFLIVLFIAVCLGAFAPVALALFVGEQFRSAASIVIYITLGFAFGGMYYMVANYIFFAGRTVRLAALTLACGIVNIAMCYGLLRRNGVVGAAQAFMLAQMLLFGGAWFLANSSYPMPWLRALRRTAVS